MEWMLQVVDEVDDTVNAVLHSVLGSNADLGVVVAGIAGMAAIGCGIAFGAAPLVIASATSLLLLAGTCKFLSVRRQMRAQSTVA